MDESPSTAAHLRTAAVLFHVLAITLMALPAPSGGMTRSSWREATVQAEFAAWRGRLAGWGVEVTPAEFEEGLWSFASSFMSVREAVLAPFDPYYRYFGTWQSWRMFVAPHTFPSTLHIDVRVNGAWQTVYVGRSDVHVWKRSVFDHDRMRSVVFRYAWAKYARSYDGFVKWVAAEAARDFPEADQVRVWYSQARTPSPDETLAGEKPEAKAIREKVLELGGFR